MGGVTEPGAAFSNTVPGLEGSRARSGFVSRWGAACSAAFLACTPAASRPALTPSAPALPWESQPAVVSEVESPPVALVGGTLLSGVAGTAAVPDGVLVLQHGRIEALGPRQQVSIPPAARIIDVQGRYVTPGLIDTHSHMGVYPMPEADGNADASEATEPVTAGLRVADAFWTQDPALPRALAAGVTTVLVLPGSANLIGGQGVSVKLTPGRSLDEMKFPGAPPILELACGENQRRVAGRPQQATASRMGNFAGYREAFQAALEYGAQFADWQAKHVAWEKESEIDHQPPIEPAPSMPPRDFGLETLLGALQGRVLVQVHCSRADEMLGMLALAEQFGFKVRAFHHAVEAYKIRDVLAARGIGVSTWADLWSSELEGYDALRENLALLAAAGVRAVLHSASSALVQRLNQEAAKSLSAGQRAGLPVDRSVALSWITSNAAWTLGIENQTGSLEVGKMADVVVWSGDPLSVYTHAEQVFIDGQSVYRALGGPRPSDFELGRGAELERTSTPAASAQGVEAQ